MPVLMFFYESLVPFRSCSCRCCFSVVLESQNQSRALPHDRRFSSHCVFPHYSSKWMDIQLQRNFTKTFALTQCQRGTTQTRVILPEVTKPCSHPQIMLLVQHKTAASCQSSCPTVYLQQTFFQTTQ